ncbi:hypothetical protein [Gloeocapsopsis dulcis]|nr:hypothetical protein [Gloeocapsopsis dulcis]WNN91621.1 hypothetical protein P0S91_11350 [Gloeocapsopsis dulcis]
MTGKFFAVLVGMLVSTAAISAPALAADNKVYPGGACTAINSGTAGLFHGNATTNLSNVNINVTCPVVRDVTGTAEGGGPDAFIDVSSPSVSCSLNTLNLQGGTHASRTATPFQLFPNVFRYDIRNVPQVSQGAYRIACFLPPGTAVLRYSVAE